MNKLTLNKRVQILSMLVEGSSMRSISRVVGVSINTVTKLLAEAGEACLDYHDENVSGLNCKRIQCDEIWSFVYAKEKNVDEGQERPDLCWRCVDVDLDLRGQQAHLQLVRRRPGC